MTLKERIIKKICNSRENCTNCPYAYYSTNENTYFCKFFSSDGSLPYEWNSKNKIKKLFKKIKKRD